MSDAPLQADAIQISSFVDSLFRYADEGSFISLRAFDQFRRDARPYFIEAVAVGSSLDWVKAVSAQYATRSAQSATPTVFAPPIATFTNPERARGVDLANGLVLSVEIDERPVDGRRQLESLLGPVTLAVQSGSLWTDPETGELQPKLHLHWRLSEATRDQEEHDRLHMARDLAAQIIGADPTGKPVVHPLRWPGSWNTKSAPRLATIVADNDAAEIHLGEALEILQQAAGLGSNSESQTGPAGSPEADPSELAVAFAHIPNEGASVHYDLWIRLGYAAWRATGGAPEGFDMWEAWSKKSAKYDAAETETTWRRIVAAIKGTNPKRIIGARTVFKLAIDAGWKPPKKAKDDNGRTQADTWATPVDFLADDTLGAPVLEERHVPAALWRFVTDTAARMGVDAYGVAGGTLVACASVISDEWAVQPKRYDNIWTENPRLWFAIVAPPGGKKSPIVSAVTKPIDILEMEARKRHTEAMRKWKADDAAARLEKSPSPPQPKLDRYMVEGTTTEALSEILRDDDEAKMRAPQGKVLSRQDEMSEFIGGLDRYRAGGKGGSDRGAYLRLYNGGRYHVDRIGRGSFAVPNWSACFLGGIQPGPIQRIAREAAEDGLLQRFMYCVPDRQEAGEDRKPDEDALKRYGALFPALVALHPASPFGSNHTPPVVFHADAHEHREDINALAVAMAAMPDTSLRLKASLDKWPGLFARLCLTFHLIEIADCRARNEPAPVAPVIPAAVAKQVAEFMREIVLPHLLRAEAVMFMSDQTGHARWIAGYILTHGLERIGTRDVTRAYGALRAPEAKRELMSVMDSLVAMAWLEPEEPTNAAKGVTSWLVNPAVHTVFAERSKAEAERRAEAKRQIAETVEKLRKGKHAA